MAKNPIRVEFFFAGGCSSCAKAREALRATAESLSNVRWSEIDIGKEPHRAVDAGVVTTPAIAIDGTLVFKSAPTLADFRSALKARMAKF